MQTASPGYSDYCKKCGNSELIDNQENFFVCTSCGSATPCVSTSAPTQLLDNIDQDIFDSSVVPLHIQMLLLDIIANNNICYSLHDEALTILNRIWPFFRKKHIKKESILSYCLYKAYITQEIPISLNKAAFFTKSPVKELQKIIGLINTNGVSDIFYPEDQVTSICSQLNILPHQAEFIKDQYNNCVKKNCQSSPNAIIASIIYFFTLFDKNPPFVVPMFKNLTSLTLPEIAHSCNVRPTTVLKSCRKIKKILS